MPEDLFPCSTCQRLQGLTDFPKDKHRRLLQGVPQQCKACIRTHYLAWYAAHSAEVIARSRKWDIDHADYVKQRNHDYYLTKQESVKAYQKANKDHFNAKRRERLALPQNKVSKLQQDRVYRETHSTSVQEYKKHYTKTHIETIKARVKAWRKAHPEKKRNQDIVRHARQHGANRVTLSDAQWREIQQAFDHRCAYCGRKMPRLTRDHITPTVEKGDHHIHNIVPACQSCNSRKGIGPPLKPVQPLLLTLAPAHRIRKVS